MADLELIVADLSTVPTAYHGLYVENPDGGHELNVSGVEDTAALKKALKAERAAAAEAKKAHAELAKKYAGVDPEKFAELMKSQEEAEMAKLSETERFAKQTEQMKASHAKRLEEVSASSTAEIEKAMKLAETYRGRVLENALRSAAVEAGLHPGAHEDAILLGHSLFSLDETGSAVIRDADGEVKIGPDGKNPLNASDWLESIRGTKAHWFSAASSGGGRTGDTGGGPAGGRTMKRSAFFALSAADQRATIKKGTKIVD